MSIIWVVAAAFFAVCCAVMAKNKNRNVALWLLLGAVLGLIAFVTIALLSNLCAYCGHNFSKNSDGLHCGHCGKGKNLDKEELAKYEILAQTALEQGCTLKLDGVKITVVQRTGARLHFVGVDALEEYFA